MSKEEQQNDKALSRWQAARRLPELFAIGLVGGWLATLIHLPAAWLTGSLIIVAIVTLSGRQYHFPDWLKQAAFALIGLILGSGFSPDTIAAIARWPLSVALLAVTVVTISWAAYWVLRRAGGWDHATALFASLPGALGYVLAIAEAARADMQRVAIAQSIRLFALIAFLPLMLSFFSESEIDAEPAQDMATLPSLDIGPLLAIIAVTTLLALGTLRLKVPAGPLLAGMAASGSAYLSGLVDAPMPDWFAIPGFVVIGAMIGVRFGSISPAALMKLTGISLLSLAAALSVSLFASVICAYWLDFPLGQVLLAFAPGGFETMVLLAFLFDLNPAYVAGHHLIRYLGLVILTPIVTSYLTRHRNKDTGI